MKADGVAVRAYDVRAVEARWREAWERTGCFDADFPLRGAKFFNYDSGPFPNGDLHMGHLRTYALGDMTARYQRAQGKTVLYCTEWDAFGLPNELAALKQGSSPAELTHRCIAGMREQLQRLGISYDWSRVRSTCDPAYYRWTQWLFLELLDQGLVELAETTIAWCPNCNSSLARVQVESGRCWRCAGRVERRRIDQWCVRISRFEDRLRAGLGKLEGWSGSALGIVEGFLRSASDDRAEGSRGARDWYVSRQRAWGTPIPIVHCDRCGVRPVPRDELPVRLPDDLDWSLGWRALASHSRFGRTRCPCCGGAARRETDTLDCFFDDIWCFLSCLSPLDRQFDRARDELRQWMPVDRFHSGLDTFYYLHIHRFLGAVLHDMGMTRDREPIRSYIGHDMVLSGGRKMSKHLGNAVPVRRLIDKHGADALRVAILWAAGPQRTIDWRPELIDRASGFLDRVYRVTYRSAEVLRGPDTSDSHATSSRAVGRLGSTCRRAAARVGRLIEDYRPNAALDVLGSVLGEIEGFALHRIDTCRVEPADRAELRGALAQYCIALSPFAPFVTEELWHALGESSLVSGAAWVRR